MIVGIIIGVLLGYKYLLPVVIPFLAAWYLACRLHPLTVKLERKFRIKRSVTGIAALTILLALFFLAVFWILAELSDQIAKALSYLPLMKEEGGRFLEGCCKMLEDAAGIPAKDSQKYVMLQIQNLSENFLQTAGGSTVRIVVKGAGGALFLLSGLMVAFIGSILLMEDMETIRRKIREYSWLAGTRRVAARLGSTIVVYLRAQVVIIGLVAAVCSVGFWLMGSPYFLLLGLLLGVVDAFPVLGTGAFLYPAAVVFLLRKNVALAIGCVVLDVATSILREMLEPRLVGDKLGISPIVILASVYAGILFYGGIGVLIGPLSYSTICEIGREWDLWD